MTPKVRNSVYSAAKTNGLQFLVWMEFSGNVSWMVGLFFEEDFTIYMLWGMEGSRGPMNRNTLS